MEPPSEDWKGLLLGPPKVHQKADLWAHQMVGRTAQNWVGQSDTPWADQMAALSAAQTVDTSGRWMAENLVDQKAHKKADQWVRLWVAPSVDC